MTDVYRSAYLARLTVDPAGAALVPGEDGDLQLLLDAHVLLKALYEVRWELSIRPAWVGWPLGAVVQMLERR